MSLLAHEGLKALAASTGLSVSTVSRVLSGKAAAYRISAETEARVRQAAGRQGIVVNEVARGLRLRTTLTLGLVIPDISNPFFAALARHVERLARARGYSVLLADSQERNEVEVEAVRLMRSRRVDGLVVAPVGLDAAHLQPLCQEGWPLVLVDRLCPELDCPGVTADNRAGAQLAVQHLLQRGHRRIACLQGLPEVSANQERVRGYREALAEAGLPIEDDLLIGGDYRIETGREAVRRRFADPCRRPTALLALGNLIALGALQALRELHLAVPGQVSLISFDEQPWAELIDPPLTTVSQPIEALAAQAMERLFAQLQPGAAPLRSPGPTVRLPVRLIERGSVGAPPA